MILIILGLLCCLLIILPAFIPRRYRIRYYLCYISFLTFTFITSMIILPMMLLFHPIVDKKIHSFAPIALKFCIWPLIHEADSKEICITYITGTMACKILGIDFEIRNRTALDKYKKAIIVLNHQSIFDLLGNILVFRPKEHFSTLAKKELLYIFPFGLSLKLGGAIFVNRQKNAHLALEELRKCLKDQEKKIVIFPEGTRNKDGWPFLPFKKGAFRLAIEFQCPIIPVVISPNTFIKPDKTFDGGRFIYSIMEPIPTTNLEEKDINDLIKKTKELMEKEYIKLKNELSVPIDKEKIK